METSPALTASTRTNSERFQRRLLYYFGILALVCVGVFLGEYFLGMSLANALQTFPDVSRSARGTMFLLPSFTLVGFMLLLSVKFSGASLHAIDLIFSALFLGGIAFLVAVVFPGQGFLYPYVFFLFLHATLVPARPWVQVLLACMAVLSFAMSTYFSFQFLTETQKVLISDNSGNDFWRTFFVEIVFMILMGALSIEISRLLGHSYTAPQLEDRFGKYTLTKFIGTGGMGKVYLASHSDLCRPTALKVMQPKKEEFNTAVTRFEREVQLCSTLSHPNTVTIFDYGRHGDSLFYYAMECLEGMDLQKLVEQFGPMPANRVVPILLQVCASLAEAHSKNIVHRDIKPSNIFLAQVGGIFDFVKVLDFGLAKDMSDGGPRLTESHVFLGTPAYVAPEMIVDRLHVDPRTDIYMLGCVAYWMLTAHPPFTADNDAQMLVEHVKTLPRWPSDLTGNEIPADLERITMRCMEKKMEDRFANVEEIIAALSEIRFERPWSQASAREWWQHHPPSGAPDGQIEMPFPLTKGPAPVPAVAPHPQ